MTSKKIAILYDSFDRAAKTVRDLEAANVPREDISVAASNADDRDKSYRVDAASDDVLDDLTAAGLGLSHANIYAEGLRRGGVLVTAQVDETEAASIESLMRANGAVDPEARGMEYRQAGWQEFDPKAPSLTTAELEVERARARLHRRAS